jgi:hypothetical protein
MDERHREYLEYYQARAAKYEGDPMYANSFASEKAFVDALASAGDLRAFKGALEQQNLPFKNAVALIVDHETARRRFYEQWQEDVRAHGSAEILGALPQMQTLVELTTRVSELQKKNSDEILVDLFVDFFYGDLGFLENIETLERAPVAPQWRADVVDSIRRSVERKRKVWYEDFLPNARRWKPDFVFPYDDLWLPRHRRKMPLSDALLQRRIQQHRTILGQ